MLKNIGKYDIIEGAALKFLQPMVTFNIAFNLTDQRPIGVLGRLGAAFWVQFDDGDAALEVFLEEFRHPPVRRAELKHGAPRFDPPQDDGIRVVGLEVEGEIVFFHNETTPALTGPWRRAGGL